MKPYFYKIQEITSGKYYVGCQYGKKSDPDNLWVTYFTSNHYINNQPKTNFIIIKKIQRNDARNYEKRYLSKCYKILGREKFLEIMINRNLAPGILNTKETIEKANIKRRISNKKAAMKRVESGTHNFQLNTYAHSDEWFRKIKLRMNSDLNPGKNPENIKKRITDEYRKKQSDGAKGNTNVKGYRWWTNGAINRRSKNSPGEEFYLGTTKRL
jgi:hypothetical protein